jgi:VWFA-related protein
VRRTALALLTLAVVSTPGVAQQPTFRSRVSVVRVDVLATDGGKPLMNLVADDFEVRDNSALQHVEAAFGDVEPIDVLFAFDRSESTRGETLMRLRESATALLDSLQPTDRAGLLTFNHTFSLSVPLGPSADVRDALQAIEPAGSTSILDAVATTIALASGSDRRTLVLLFTDGVDTLSWLSEKTVLEAARGSEAVMYAVTVPERRNSAQPLMGDEGQLKRLVEASGGRLLRADRPAQLRERFIEVLGEMRARYVLTYIPTDPDTAGWHAVSVTLKNKKGRIAARAGYVVPPAAR